MHKLSYSTIYIFYPQVLAMTLKTIDLQNFIVVVYSLESECAQCINQIVYVIADHELKKSGSYH